MDTDPTFETDAQFTCREFLSRIAGWWQQLIPKAHSNDLHQQCAWIEGVLAVLVDRDFYDGQLAARGLRALEATEDPFRDWIARGSAARITPHPLFSENYYLRANADVSASGQLAFEHFLEWGVWEGREPNSVFNTDWYSSMTVDAPPVPVFVDYLRRGASAGQSPSEPIDDLLRSWELGQGNAFEPARIGLDRVWAKLMSRDGSGSTDMSLPVWVQYCASVLAISMDDFLVLLDMLESADQDPTLPRVERVKIAMDELLSGTDPKLLLFDPAYYRSQKARLGLPSVAGAASLLLDWVTEGRPASIVPIRTFDSAFYMRENADVLASRIPPFQHFARYGVREGREPNVLFSSGFYWSGIAPGTQLNSFVDYLRVVDNDTRMPSPEAIALFGPLASAGLPLQTISRLARVAQEAICLMGLDVDDIAFIIACHCGNSAGEEGNRLAAAHEAAAYLERRLWLRAPFTLLFDADCYSARFAARPTHAGGDATLDFIHWLAVGRKLRINPSPYFDERYYRASNQDLHRMDGDLFSHFLWAGWNESRSPSAWFAVDAFRAGLADHGKPVTRDAIERGVASGQPLQPFLSAYFVRYPNAHGGLNQPQYRELLSCTGALPIVLSRDVIQTAIEMLDPLYVAEQAAMPEPLDSADILVTFIRGLATDLSPNRFFEPALYRKLARELDVPWIMPSEGSFVHWLNYGRHKDIVPSSNFDEAFYEATYPDVTAWRYAHFISYGLYEGRLPRKLMPFNLPRPLRGTDGLDLLQARVFGGEAVLRSPVDGASGQLIPVGSIAQRILATTWSPAYRSMVEEAASYDPLVGEVGTTRMSLVAPYCDNLSLRWHLITSRLRYDSYSHVICVPWMRMGGADLVGSVLLQALNRLHSRERVLVLQTDQNQRDWAHLYPQSVDAADISPDLAGLSPEECEYILFSLLRSLGPKAVFNVNSNLCWRVLRRYGKRLAPIQLFAYLFCWDYTPGGLRAGYPSDFFAETVIQLDAVLTDTDYLKSELARMYTLPREIVDMIQPVYTSAAPPPPGDTVADQHARRPGERDRPVVLWAGRLDRQKRFDLVCAIAERMPEVDFLCWGAPVLDAPPDMTMVPSNVTMQGTFKNYSELDLAQAVGWLYTSDWDGLPTLLIELAMRGVPIVASAVGGVPELVTPETGWPIRGDEPERYVDALREMIADPRGRCRRAALLQRTASARHSIARFDAQVALLLGDGACA